MNKIKSINNSMNQIINIYHKPRYHQLSFINTQHIHQCSSCTKFNMYFFHYISNHIQQTILLKFTYLKNNSVQIELNQKKKFARSSQITFDFQLKQIITKLSF